MNGGPPVRLAVPTLCSGLRRTWCAPSREESQWVATPSVPQERAYPPMLVPSTSPASPGTTTTTTGPSELLHRCEVQLRSWPRRDEMHSVCSQPVSTQCPGALDRTHLAEAAADLRCYGAQHDGCEPRAFCPLVGRLRKGGVMVGKPSQQPQKALCFYPVSPPPPYLGKGSGEASLPSLGTEQPPCPLSPQPSICFPQVAAQSKLSHGCGVSSPSGHT